MVSLTDVKYVSPSSVLPMPETSGRVESESTQDRTTDYVIGVSAPGTEGS